VKSVSYGTCQAIPQGIEPQLWQMTSSSDTNVHMLDREPAGGKFFLTGQKRENGSIYNE
jgi:hypothetical protein